MQLQLPEVKKEQEIKEQEISQTRINPIKTELTQTVVALVSSAKLLNENMLMRCARIGNMVIRTALDTCATNCFVSKRTSEQLNNGGYKVHKGPVSYDIRQGNPLCTTTEVHMVPVCLINNEGERVTWRMCLFIVANCGADAIIGYPTLSQGHIISYYPPSGYETTLAKTISNQTKEYEREALEAVQSSRNYVYGPPMEIANCFKTAAKITPKEAPIDRLVIDYRDRNDLVVTTDASAIGSASTVETRSQFENRRRTGRALHVYPDDVVIEGSTAEEVEGAMEELSKASKEPAQELAEQGCKPPPKLNKKEEGELDMQRSTSEPNSPLVSKTKAYEKTGRTSVQCSQPLPLIQEKIPTPESTYVFTKQLEAIPKAKPKKGATKALTEEKPYGENPPLAEEVTEALQILKQLSENPPESLWTQAQLDEIQARLSKNRPEWSNCLTMTHTTATFDKETAQFIEDLMDSPRMQKSVFAKSLRIPANVKQFDINSLPGEDWWLAPKARRFKNPLIYAVVDKFLDWQLDDDLLSTSNAARPAVITVAEKIGREPRCCCDYRLRNSRTDVPVFPMPDIQEHLDEAMGYEYYCSFDMAKMFNQIEINPDHRDLAAFITHRGVHAPHRIQFGLAGGPQHAVREVGGLMNESSLTNGTDFTKWALEENEKGQNPPYELNSAKIVKGSNLKPFIDDVTIKSNIKKGLIKLVELFFEFCELYSLLLSRKKANICKTHLKMLGMVVSKSGKHLDPSRIITLLEAVKPRSKVTMQSLLCSYNFVRMFVPNFSQIVAPLYDATKGIIWKGRDSDRAKGISTVDPEFIWTPEMTRAYDQLRAALLESPILVCPDWTQPLFLSVDASLKGEGWVLWQLLPTENPGSKVAVAILYGSRKYTGTEAAWEVTRQECTAIRDALYEVEEYVFGQEFYLFTDHLNLRWMHNSVNRAVIRMRDFLSQYRMKIVHCPGIWNNADSHSRLESNEQMLQLASDITAAAEAKLSEGNGLKFSCGTCTDEDNLAEGIIKRTHPYKDTNGREFNSTDATVLFTCMSNQCSVENCAMCNDPPELWSDEDTSDEESEFKSTCLNTEVEFNTSAECLSVLWTPYEVICQVLNATGSNLSPEELTEAAKDWNQKEAVRALYTEVAIDEVDKEDYEWCGPMHRAALVLLTADAGRYSGTGLEKKETRGIPTGGISILKIQNEGTKFEKQSNRERWKSEALEQEKNRKVKWQDTQPEHEVENKVASTVNEKRLKHAEGTVAGKELSLQRINTQAEPSQSIKSQGAELDLFTVEPVMGERKRNSDAPVELEQKTQGTQTSPADFRAMNIKIPMNADFAAVHGGLHGHHGVEYSYRKLLIHCGSKWANERGQATKVKEALRQYIEACPVCQKIKSMRNEVKCKHSFIISRPFLEMSYDIIVFTSADKHGMRYLIVGIDNFSKLVEIKAVSHKDAMTIARFLLEIAGRYGHIARLRSDRDPAFTGQIIKYLNEIRNSETIMCIPYHPQANSICERQNAIVMQHVSSLCVDKALGPETRLGWSDVIPIVYSIVNNTPKNPLGISPLAMVYGVFANYERPLLPARMPVGTVSTPVDYVDELMVFQNTLLLKAEDIQSEHLNKFIRKYDKEMLQSNSETRKRNHEAEARSFNSGDFVIINKNAKGGNSKLTPKWVGPRLVLDRRDNDPTHPVLDLLDLTDLTTSEFSIEDCRLFNTGWFEEITMMQELVKLAASDKEEFTVESIIDHKPRQGTKGRTTPLVDLWFKVKWLDFEESQNSWEPWSALKELEPFAQYAHDHPELNLTPAEVAPKTKRKK